MFPEQAAKGSFERLRLYLEASHGGAGGMAADRLANFLGWAPGLVGMGLRSAWDRLWVKGEGTFARESGVRIWGTRWVSIGPGVYLDRGVYLHGRPGGLAIGARTRVMGGSILHVYNFRDLASSGIRVGQDCVIGFNSIVTGQGGVTIEDKVIMAPGVMVLPVGHLHSAADVSIREQGISAKGIRIREGAWIGAGSIILDGATVGRNAVVGAGSVVTRDVADGGKVAGNPARPLDSDK